MLGIAKPTVIYMHISLVQQILAVIYTVSSEMTTIVTKTIIAMILFALDFLSSTIAFMFYK